jgi:hypothetical protein
MMETFRLERRPRRAASLEQGAIQDSQVSAAAATA